MKRKILAIFLIGITLFAALLGWRAQEIAYYLENHLLYQDPLQSLTIITVTSVILFIINTILLVIKKGKSKIYIILLISNIVIGCIVSLWSLFVLAMWWG